MTQRCLSTEELDVMRHCLGLQKRGGKWTWHDRNAYVCDPCDHWERLVRDGFATSRDSRICIHRLYSATKLGISETFRMTPLKQRGLIFSLQQARLAVEGRQTSIRRQINDDDAIWRYPRVGDLLWIKESFRIDLNTLEPGGYVSPSFVCGKFKVEYRDGSFCMATPNGSFSASTGWRSPMHMPQWAARPNRFLVTSAYVQRVYDMNDEDAKREGFECIGEFLQHEETVNEMTPKPSQRLAVLEFREVCR